MKFPKQNSKNLNVIVDKHQKSTENMKIQFTRI